jgi:hypothetical protein
LYFGYVERLVVLLSCLFVHEKYNQTEQEHHQPLHIPKVQTNRTRAPPASPNTQSTNKQDKSTTSLSTYPKYKQTGQEHHQPLHIPKVQTNRKRAPPASPHTKSTNKQDKSTTSLSTYPNRHDIFISYKKY